MQACELLTQHLTASRAVDSFSTGRPEQRAVLTTAFSKPSKCCPHMLKWDSYNLLPLSTAYVALEICTEYQGAALRSPISPQRKELQLLGHARAHSVHHFTERE